MYSWSSFFGSLRGRLFFFNSNERPLIVKKGYETRSLSYSELTELETFEFTFTDGSYFVTRKVKAVYLETIWEY